MARPKRTPSQKQSKRRTSPSLVAHLSDGVRSGIRNFPNKFLAQEIPDSRPDPIHLHVVRDVPLSPYVIDLSPVQRVRPLVERPDPAFLRAPIDILDGLRVPFEDIVGQLEQEERPAIHVRNFEPLVHRPAHQILWEQIETGADQIFHEMDLPETDQTVDALEEEDEQIYTLDDVVAQQVTSSTAPTRTPFRIPFYFHPSWKRAVAGFVCLSFVFVLPIQAMKQVGVAKRTQAQVELAGAAALDELSLAATALQSEHYETAAGDFERAASSFVHAQETLSSLSLTVDAITQAIPQSRATIDSVAALIEVGENLSRAAEEFSRALNDLRSTTSEDLTLKLTILTDALAHLEPFVTAANTALTSVQIDALPEAQREHVSLLATALPDISSTISDALRFSETIHTLLGGAGTMRYLVLFQNNTELRPTGGFIGSFAEVTVRDGKIQELIVPSGGSYDLQGSLTEFVAAPSPLQLLRARWEFQDGNWFPDFPTTAEKLLWFYDHSGGPTVDGVIAINATSVAELLAIVGAIDMPEYGRTIDSENFLFETQKIVEVETAPDEAPKQFIADLAPRLLDRIETIDVNSLLDVLEQVATTFSSREAQVYVQDDALQKLLDELGWSGRVEQTSGDYLMVVDANLGGGKTDLVIEEDVSLSVAVQTDGTIENTVTITRTHKGLTGALFTGVNNVSYVRVYTPRGSELLAASGDFAAPATELFEESDIPLADDELLALVGGEMLTEPTTGTVVNEEFGKTVFGNWMQTKPGATSTIQYTYRLPFTLEGAGQQSFLDRMKMAIGLFDTERYSLFVQKQSGALNRRTNVSLEIPHTLLPLWSSDESVLTEDGATMTNTTDHYIGVLFE